jgi:hypothetical protein
MKQLIATGGNRKVTWTRVGSVVSIAVRIPAKTSLQNTIPAVIAQLFRFKR